VSLPARIPWDRFSRDPRVPSYAGLRDLAPDSLPVDLREQALASYRSDRREALSLFTGVNLARVVANKQQIVEQKRAKPERKRRKEHGP
jgi:hypothetical protein